MEMINRNRCFFIKVNGKCRGIITYFLCNGDVDNYSNKEIWEILDDDEKGDTCYIDVLLTNKFSDNPKYSIETWKNLKEYIKLNHPNINKICFRRYKNNRIREYLKDL